MEVVIEQKSVPVGQVLTTVSWAEISANAEVYRGFIGSVGAATVLFDHTMRETCRLRYHSRYVGLTNTVELQGLRQAGIRVFMRGKLLAELSRAWFYAKADANEDASGTLIYRNFLNHCGQWKNPHFGFLRVERDRRNRIRADLSRVEYMEPSTQLAILSDYWLQLSD